MPPPLLRTRSSPGIAGAPGARLVGEQDVVDVALQPRLRLDVEQVLLGMTKICGGFVSGFSFLLVELILKSCETADGVQWENLRGLGPGLTLFVVALCEKNDRVGVQLELR